MAEIATKAFEYETRYCAYVDILGFRELIDQLRTGNIAPFTLRDILTKMHKPPSGSHYVFYGTGFAAQSISDAVAVSTKATGDGLMQIFLSLESLALSLLREGYFVRGAIVKGKLYHDDKMVFGEALVRAFTLESEVARYPRIMIASNVIKDLETYTKADPPTNFNGRVQQGDDGPYYLHVLRQMEVALGLGDRFLNDEHFDDQFYKEIAVKIQERFDESVDTPRHFEKVQWFAKYWNGLAARGANRIPSITGPGVYPSAFQ